MAELGQLESHHEEFAKRKTRIVAVSLDNREQTAKTAEKFPHLLVLSDKDRGLSGAVEVIGPHRGPDGEEADAPTTFLIDRRGLVRWVFRPDRFLVRLKADVLLDRVDEYLVDR
jgi:peroxiredoxin